MPQRWTIPALAVTLVIGCKKDEAPPPGEAAEQPADGEGAAKAEAGPEQPGASSQTATPTAAASAPVRRPLAAGARQPLIGHVALASLDRLVSKTRTQLVPGPLSLMVTTDALRSALLDKADDEQGRAAVKHFDMTRPVVCGVADPLQFDEPVGCVLGYEGGATQFSANMAIDHAVAPAEGHAAHLRSSEGRDFYIDERDGLVVLTSDPRLYAEAGDALLALATAPAGRDLEFVLYPGSMMALYAPIIRDELAQVAAGTRTGSELRTRLEERAWGEVRKRLSAMEVTLDEEEQSVFEKWLARLDATTAEDAKEALALLDQFAPYAEQIDAVGVGFELEPDGLVFSAWYDAVPGSALQTTLLAGPKLDDDWVALLPESSFTLGASVDSDEALPGLDTTTITGEDDVDEELTDVVIETLAELYEAQTGNPSSSIEPDIRAFLEERDELYGPRSAWSIFDDPAGPGALIVILENLPGKSGREGWARWAERFSAERILGKELVEYVTWEHAPAAFEVDGTPVDRWTLRLTPKVAEELEDELFLAKAGTWLVEHGGLEVHVDRVEKDGRTSFVFAPEGAESFVRTALAAQGGGSPAAGLSVIMARGPHPVSLWGLNIKAIVDAARDAAGDEVPAALKTAAVGTDLSDVYGVSYLREDGGAAELVISQRLIDQLKAAAMK